MIEQAYLGDLYTPLARSVPIAYSPPKRIYIRASSWAYPCMTPFKTRASRRNTSGEQQLLNLF
jgi:hypothetical protein